MIYKDHLCETIRRSSLRCSRPLCSSQSTGGTFSACRTATARKGPEVQLPHSRHPVPQDPTACMHPTEHPDRSSHRSDVLNPSTRTGCPIICSTHELTGNTHSVLNRPPGHPKECQKLLRKEVIQPHLPVRLPCYDLVLITDPTFDGSLHKG